MLSTSSRDDRGRVRPCIGVNALAGWKRFGEEPDLLVWGDCMEAMRLLLAAGRGGTVPSIYFDPPFEAEECLGTAAASPPIRIARNQVPIHNASYGKEENMRRYESWLRSRLELARDLLASDGCLCIHANVVTVATVRSVADSVIGASLLCNEVVWVYGHRRAISKPGGVRLRTAHGYLVFYGKLRGLEANYRDATSRGSSRRVPTDVWNGLWYSTKESEVQERDPAPRKPEALVRRVLGLISVRGDTVLDCFTGTGTCPAIAARMQRRWIACDIRRECIQFTQARLTRKSSW